MKTTFWEEDKTPSQAKNIINLESAGESKG
jgi:hypothetical protein